MAAAASDDAFRQVNQLLELGAVGAMSDGQLLDRFVARSDAGADVVFEMLVIRHGPMVFRACQNVLRNSHDAEDAFQAVFLVLANRAAVIRRSESVGSWLFGVAHRVATRLRRATARREARHQRAASLVAAREQPQEHDHDWEAVHAEINGLPERLRTPVVLCYLQGQTYDAAAHQLGISPVAVRSRLVRARERLRLRLTRRGVALPSALLSACAASRAQSALSAPLIHTTVRIALGFAAGNSASALARGVLNSMFVARLRVGTLFVCLGIAGSFATWRSFAASGVPSAQRETRPSLVMPPAAAKETSGTVRDRDGKPVAGVLIAGTERYREIMFRSGVLDDFVRHDWLSAETGPAGHYRFAGGSMKRPSPPIKEFGLFAYHEKGYARRSADELRKSGDLTLEPWSRVYGIATVLGKPLANVPIRFTLDATDEHSMFYDVYEYETMTDDRGRFKIEHVPAGVGMASTGTPRGKNKTSYARISSARRLIKPGETVKLNIGGFGRPVVGRLRTPEGMPIRVGGGRLELKIDPREPPLAPDRDADAQTEAARERRFFRHFNAYRSPAGLAQRLAQRFHVVQIHDDATFEAVEVEPGTYTLAFWVGDDHRNPIATRVVVVPPMPESRSDTPLDIGTVDLTTPLRKSREKRSGM